MTVTFTLSLPRNFKRFEVVGQVVFRWIAGVLLFFLLTRISVMIHWLDSEAARNINSIAFITAVAGIMWNFYRHGKTNK
jgi:hypothetical protein